MREKKQKWKKKIGHCLVGGALILSMLLDPLTSVKAAESKSDDTTVDFILVLDCSGSMEKTDPEGLSVSAAKMFVDMIPKENARVGVIGFGQDWGEDQTYVYEKNKDSLTQTTMAYPLSKIENTKSKSEVQTTIESIAEKKGADSYTNEGYALQAAVDMLTQGGAEPKEACIVLMSDGRLKGTKDASSKEEAESKGVDLYWMEKDHKTRGSVSLDFAIEDLQKKEWPVYCLELNFDNGAGDFTYDTGLYQMQRIAEETGGEKVTAGSNADVGNAFSDIFAKFYDVNITGKEGTIKNGQADLEFEVEEMIAEMNITVSGSKMDKIEEIELTDGQGNTKKYKKSKKIEETDSRIVNFSDSNYALIKLLQPKAGKWRLTAYGSDGIEISMMTIPMMELNFNLTTSADLTQVIPKGGSVDFSASFVYNGNSLSSEKFYLENPAYLEVVETGDKFDMTGGSDNYTGQVKFDKSGDYTVRAVVESGRFRNGRKESGEFVVKVENLPSEIIATMEDLNLSFNEKKEIDCTKYFSNPDDDELKYTVDTGKISDIAAKVENGKLTLTTGVKAGDFEVIVRVNDGAMKNDIEQRFTVHLVNQPLEEKGSSNITKTISYDVKGIPNFIKKLFGVDVEEVGTIDGNDYFEDPDGIPPVFEIKELPEDSVVTVENGDPGVLNIIGKSKGEVTFKLIAKDASDETISFEKEVTVKSVSAKSYIWGNIWGKVVILVIVLAIIIILLLTAFAGRKIHGVWDVTVGGSSEDEVKLGNYSSGKRSKCTLNAVLRDLELPECESEQIMMKGGNNWTQPVYITGLENAEEIEYRGKTYSAEEKALKKAVIKKGQSININVSGSWITLSRL